MSTAIQHRSLIDLITEPVGRRLGFVEVVRQDRTFRRDVINLCIPLLAGVLFLNVFLIGVGALLVLVAANKWRQLRRLYLEGIPLPAKVISSEPPLVAIPIDFAKTERYSYPHLLVMDPGFSLQEYGLQSGDRTLAVGCLHGGNHERWGRVHAKCVLRTLTSADDTRIIASKIRSWAWEDLEEDLFELPKFPKKGLLEISRSRYDLPI